MVANSPRNVCVVTGTRAEFGLLRWLIEDLSNSEELNLQLVVTGMHLSPEFGLTVKEVENTGYFINDRVEMLLSSDSPVGIAKSMGLGTIGFADVFNRLKPDLLLVLGDRFEIFSAVTAAMVARIPIAHLHGGELTEGAIDESIRHSITKMSHLHFVASDEYRRRVIQLGEIPSRVFHVGGLGVDNISRLKLLSREELESSLDIQLQDINFLITFHPVTLEANSSSHQIEELFSTLSQYPKAGLIFTMPNADTDGRILIQQVQKYCSSRSNAKAFTSLGQLRYLSALSHVDAVIGNSSSGLLEAPSLRIPTLNIGDRQKGRLKASSVVDSEPTATSMLRALETILSCEFQQKLQSTVNPYGEGGASTKIIETLEKLDMSNLLKKPFHDIP